MKHAIVVAALAMSALSAQSAEIPITYLPFQITAPGRYVLTSNLSYPGPTQFNDAAININAQGPVILDMKGFTITGVPSDHYSIGIIVGPASDPVPLIIRNGTLVNFQYGIITESFQQEGLKDITINNMSFNLDPTTPGAYEEIGVSFTAVRNSTVSNCSFSNGLYGIEDFGSPGGNVYSNDYFANSIDALLVGPFPPGTVHGQSLPIKIKHFSTAPPMQ
jgi:hypothetical protein